MTVESRNDDMAAGMTVWGRRNDGDFDHPSYAIKLRTVATTRSALGT